MDFFPFKYVRFSSSIVVFSLLATVYCEMNFLLVFIIFIYNIYNLWIICLAVSCNYLNFPNLKHPVERNCALEMKMLQFYLPKCNFFSRIPASSSL